MIPIHAWLYTAHKQRLGLMQEASVPWTSVVAAGVVLWNRTWTIPRYFFKKIEVFSHSSLWVFFFPFMCGWFPMFWILEGEASGRSCDKLPGLKPPAYIITVADIIGANFIFPAYHIGKLSCHFYLKATCPSGNAQGLFLSIHFCRRISLLANFKTCTRSQICLVEYTLKVTYALCTEFGKRIEDKLSKGSLFWAVLFRTSRAF